MAEASSANQSPRALVVDEVSDPVCPWCFIAAPRLSRSLAGRGRVSGHVSARDFETNARASDPAAGEYPDPAGGERDIAAMAGRCLHGQSFRDNPTRIFRAVRLATRLGFSLETDTARLLDRAVAAGALASIARERIWRELFLAFEEESAPNAIAALSAAGVLDVLFGTRPYDRDLDPRLQRTARALAGTALDKQVMYTAALLHGNASPVDLEGSGLSQKRARHVVQPANELPRVNDALT